MSNRPYLKGLLCCVINDLVINCVLCVSHHCIFRHNPINPSL